MQNIPLNFSPEITNTLFIISLTILSAIILDNILRSFIKIPKSFEGRRSRTYITILRKAVTITIYIIAVNFILAELGINITPFLASATVIGIVVGIGARALIEDLISGIFLLSQDFITIGDQIKIDEAEGTIEKVGFRTLIIRGDKGELYMIPNGQVKKIVNFSRHRSYANIDIPLKADQNIDTALKSMNDALSDLQKDKDFEGSINPGSSILGIEEMRVESRIILRAKIITTPAIRDLAARKFRYYVKKHFEKNHLTFA